MIKNIVIVNTVKYLYNIHVKKGNEIINFGTKSTCKKVYEQMGFKVYKRTEVDEQGKPYPLLYMNLEG